MKRSGVLLVALASLACDAGSPAASPPPPDVPEGRPNDALLDSPTLRNVVELQTFRSVEPLIDLLGASDPTVRARSAFALASVRSPQAVPALVQALEDDDALVRGDAAFALGQIVNPEAEAALIAALGRESDPNVRVSIVRALGKSGRQAAAGVLAALREPALDAEIALALGRLGLAGVEDPALLERLLDDLDDADPQVRWNASFLMGQAERAGFWAQSRRTVRLALDAAEPGDEAVLNLVKAMGRIQDMYSRDRLVERLQSSPDWRIRATAAEYLVGWNASAPVSVALADALWDPSVHVRVNAATSLAASPQPEGVLVRVRAYMTEHPEDVATAGPLLALLGQSGDTVTAFAWMDALTPADVDGWDVAVAALASIAGGGAVERLREAALLDEPRVATEATRSLSRRWRGDRRVPDTHETYHRVFLDLLENGSPRVASLAAEALEDPALQELGGSQGMRAPSVDETRRAQPGRPVPDWDALGALGPRPLWILETDAGRVVIEMDANEAPLTVQTIARLTREGRYDGSRFHRVVPAFVVQGGDFDRGDGTGDAGVRLVSEFTRIPFRRGTVGMARLQSRDTEGSQFFIAHATLPTLDGDYTAFGRVVEGMENVDRLWIGDRIRTASIEVR